MLPVPLDRLSNAAPPEASRRRLAGAELRLKRSNEVIDRAHSIRSKYGQELGWPELLKLLEDRSCIPFPCEVRFDPDPLLPYECAFSVPRGNEPGDGYTIFVHPACASELSHVPYLVLYQIALLALGAHATPEEAEAFGAAALGLEKDEYCRALCALADQLGGDELF